MLNVKDLQLIGQGQHAKFYKINEYFGIKVYHDACSNPGLKSPHRLLTEEMKALIQCSHSKFTPRYYDCQIVIDSDYALMGIVMTFLGTTSLSSRAIQISNRCKLDRMEIINRIKNKMDRKLRKEGIIHQDLNEWNIVRYENCWYVIDLYGVQLIK